MSNEKNVNGCKAVFFCDGSSRPNPGFGGYGIFGYLYKDAPRPKNTKHPVKANLNFTSTGISPTKGTDPIEITHIFECIRALNTTKATNNDGELQATITSLEKFSQIEGLTRAMIYTDSEYVSKCFKENLSTWATNGWKRKDGRPVVHIQEWEAIHTYRQLLESRGVELLIEWVKAHNDDYGNDLADLYSVIGGNAARHQFETGVKDFQSDILTSLTPYAEYKKTYQKDFIYHFKDLFFTSAPIDDANYCFITSNEEEKAKKNMTTSTQIGKRDNTTIFMACHGYVPELITRIKQFYRSQPRGYVASCTAKLSRFEDRDLLRLGDLVPVEYLLVPVARNTKRAFSLVGGGTGSQPIFMQETAIEFPFIAMVSKLSEMLRTKDVTTVPKTHIWDVTQTFVKEGSLALTNRDKFVDFTHLTEGQLVMVQRLMASMGADIPSYLALKKIEAEIERVEVILEGSTNNNLYTLYTRITTSNRQMYSLNVVNKYLAAAVHS